MRSAAVHRPAPDAMPADVRLLRRTANALGVVGLLFIGATALVLIARQPIFAIRSIVVEGDLGHNSVSTIRANALPGLSGNFLTIDLAAVRRAFEAVPWVRSAVVQRHWPNRLDVRLEEHRAVGFWGSESGADKLVNSHGEVFEANAGDVEDDALPTLSGPDGSSAHALALLGRIEPVLAPMGSVEALALSSRGSWQATLDSGAVVVLGRGSDDDVVTRGARFVATVPEVTGRFQRRVEYADLRHVDGYAVRLRGVSTTPDAPDAKRAGKKK